MPVQIPTLDTDELRGRVRDMYLRVARQPDAEFHFELGRPLAERLGYQADELDRIPTGAIESFAGVGYHLDLADLRPGDAVLDLGSGSGMDAFIAALRIQPDGQVTGIDMTEAQLEKAERLRSEAGFEGISFTPGQLEDLPVPSASFDVVISNGVINLCPDKGRVFQEIARVLRPGGRVAIADIVTEKQLPENVTCDATLWAACIGGAAQQDDYRRYIEDAGLRVTAFREQPEYRFLSRSAENASRDYGVKSVTVAARRDG